MLTGIDIYPESEFGGFAPSPVSGVITKIRRVKCPVRKEFESSPYDYLVLLKSLENRKLTIKILHVKPVVKVGDVVQEGEEIGCLIRSGYFDFWTDPHIHVEIRKPEDPIRARGGLKLTPLLKMKNIQPLKERCIYGRITTVKPEYYVIQPEETLQYGIPVEIGDGLGVLEGGIPHYGWFGVHALEIYGVGEEVRLLGVPIGKIKSKNKRTVLAECFHVETFLDGVSSGLSLYVFPSREPFIKVIRWRSEPQFKKGSKVRIHLTNA